MSIVTISVRTIDGGNVEVEESSSRRTYGQSDVEFVDALLTAACAKIRAAYGITEGGAR